MSNPEPLGYRELIAPNRRKDSHRPQTLTPIEIPIHPLVYDSPDCYTQEFLDRIRGRLVDSVREDDIIIREVLGVDTKLDIGDESIRFGCREIPYSSVRYIFDPEKREIGAYIATTSASIRRHAETKLFLSPFNPHPMSLERLKEYAYDSSDPEKPKVHTWGIHNINEQGIGAVLLLRNFAILFNNLGLELV